VVVDGRGLYVFVENSPKLENIFQFLFVIPTSNRQRRLTIIAYVHQLKRKMLYRISGWKKEN
jgi:hypothetical protein